jgi:hypothetical protein
MTDRQGRVNSGGGWGARSQQEEQNGSSGRAGRSKARVGRSREGVNGSNAGAGGFSGGAKRQEP